MNNVFADCQSYPRLRDAIEYWEVLGAAPGPSQSAVLSHGVRTPCALLATLTAADVECATASCSTNVNRGLMGAHKAAAETHSG